MTRIGRLNAPAGVLDIPASAVPLPTGRTGAGVYDFRVNVYNPKPAAFRKLRTAIAACEKGAAPLRILTLGDSITLGYPSDGTANFRTHAWPTVARTRLSAKFGNGGTGIVYMGVHGGTGSDQDSRVVAAGTWGSAGANLGAFGTFTRSSSSTSATIAFTPEVSVDSFTFWCWVPAASAAQSVAWKIDGGSETVIDVLAANAGALGQLKAFTVPAGALGAHTLTLRVNGGTVNLWAIEGMAGTSGVRLTNLAKGSQQAAQLAATTNGAGGSLAAAFLAQPHLTNIWFGHNEYLGVPSGTNTSAFQTNMQTLITQAKLTGDVTLMTQVPNSNTSNPTAQSAYNQIVYGLADANDCAVIEIADRWGSYTAMPAAMYIDTTHPSNQGLDDIANAFLAAIPFGL
jgi:lysophospholipase L1-like esterase